MPLITVTAQITVRGTGWITATDYLLTEHDGNAGEEGAAQCVDQSEGGAVEGRGIEGEELVSGPRQ